MFLLFFFPLTVLIFSNKTSTSAFVSHFLCGRGIECKHFSANVRPLNLFFDSFVVVNPETISRMGESRVIELDFDQKVEMEMVSKSCKDLFLYPILAMISN